jgi:hypothetical protein
VEQVELVVDQVNLVHLLYFQQLHQQVEEEVEVLLVEHRVEDLEEQEVFGLVQLIQQVDQVEQEIHHQLVRHKVILVDKQGQFHQHQHKEQEQEEVEQVAQEVLHQDLKQQEMVEQD